MERVNGNEAEREALKEVTKEQLINENKNLYTRLVQATKKIEELSELWGIKRVETLVKVIEINNSDADFSELRLKAIKELDNVLFGTEDTKEEE